MRNLLGGSAAALLGLAVFLVFAGWWVLIPTNIAWLNYGDRAMHTLGWFFYRDTPWSLPPGASPRLGIELANSIALVDGLPLLAIPLKLLSPLLPHPFQYWGWWGLICFMLQGLFAYALARELNATRIIALIAAGFALITPALLYRWTLHMALASHWTILAALWLYARRTPPSGWAWPLLVGLTAAIHAYLFVMVGCIWFAAWLQRLWLGRASRALVIEPIAIAIMIALVLWTVGFFYTGSLGTIGFGYFRLNLLGPFTSFGVWSKLVPSLPHSLDELEGLSFLGVGIFGALVLAILRGKLNLRAIFTRRWALLFLLCLGFCVFALSNVIGLGDHETAPIPIGPLQSLGEIFRASGRFVWPMLYLVTIGAVVFAARSFPPAVATIALGVLLIAQIADSSTGWSAYRRSMPTPASTWPTPLVSPLWDRAPAAGYTRLRAIPVVFKNPDYQWLEYYAYTHGMDTDAVHLGRIDDAAIAGVNAADQQALTTGAFEPHTLYILDWPSVARAAAQLQPGDLLTMVDGRFLFARGGARLAGGLALPQLGTHG